MIYRKLIFLVLLLSHSNAEAQHQALSGKTDHFTTRNGLPHNTVISLYQDQTGFLWIGTANGLCKYNGIDFTPIQVPWNKGNHWVQVIQSIFEDRQGNMWFGSRSGEIISYHVESNHWQQHNKLTQQGNYVTHFYQKKEGELWLGTISGVILLYDYKRDSLFEKAEIHNKVRQLHQDDEGKLWVSGISQLLLMDQNFKEQAIAPKLSSKLKGRITATISKQGSIVFYDKDSCFVYAIGTEKINAYGLKYSANNQGVNYKATPDEYLWSTEKCVITFRPNQTDFYQYSIGKEYSTYAINDLLRDHTGLIWVATDIGLVKIDRKRYQFQAYSVEEGSVKLHNNYIRSLCILGNDLWLGFRNGSITRLYCDSGSYVFNQKKLYNIVDKDGGIKDKTTINTMMTGKDGTLWCGGLEGLFKWNKTKDLFESYTMIRENGEPMLAEEVWALCKDTEGRIWIGGRTMGLWVIDKKGISHKVSLGREQTPAVWNIYQTLRGEVWIGTSKGLFKVEENKAGNFITEAIKEQQNRNIWDITEDGKGNYFIASTDWGLSVFNENTGQFTNYTMAKGLPSNSVCGVEIDKAGNAWVSTVSGLSRLNPATGQITNFYEEDGLISNDFNFKVSAGNSAGELFFGTKNGLLTFIPPEEDEQVYIPSEVVINSMVVNGKEVVNDPDKESLPYYENNVSFRFSLLEYSRPAKHQYYYQLSPFDQGWKQTDGRLPLATYTNLPAGKYRFKLKASSDGINWEQSNDLTFTIQPAFWQRSWFVPALFLTLLSIVFAILRYSFQSRLKTEREKNEVEKKMVSLELQALQAQMNPHFIFNATNSIQHFMLKGDMIVANDYLTLFARLMRFYLEASINKKVRLSEELEMLKLYLELEQLRFDARFEFNINCTEVDTDSVEIPSMLLQPFIENAIYHGLATKKGKGQLTVEIKSDEEKDKLIILIEDNGIGRDEARKLRNTLGIKHQSRAIQLMEERMNLMNNLGEKHLSIEVVDKKDSTAKPEGTKVIITLSGNI